MEKSLRQYALWCGETLPKELRKELEYIKENHDEIHDRFYRDMTFGTSGLRGRMGVGTTRINSVVLRRATMGIADYVLEKRSHPAIVISYDTRANSRFYAEEVAQTLSSRGIDTWIMAEPQPVPLLSFTIRYMGLSGGIMITASHNPKEYNGYKVYDHYGNQIDDKKARLMETYIEKHGYFENRRKAPGTDGKIYKVPEEVLQKYRDSISGIAPWWQEELQCRKVMDTLDVIYTPLNGTGCSHVTEIFRRLGVGQVEVVENQIIGDGKFETCPSPNPENRKAFAEAEKLATSRVAQGKNPADIIIATDPDCDRMGVMVYDHGQYVLLSGNQVGELIFEYLCDCKEREGVDLKKKFVYKSLVSSPLVDVMGKARGVGVGNTLTGFKNIALKMEDLCQQGREEDFLFGFEESIGYLYGTYTRDKDGVMAAQLVALVAGYCKAQGMSLMDLLDQIHEKYGFVETRSGALHFAREKDRIVMSEIMESLFRGELDFAAGFGVKQDDSYRSSGIFRGVIDCDGTAHHSFIVRPSGTELKLKSYVFAEGETNEEAETMADKILQELQNWLEKKKEENYINE